MFTPIRVVIIAIVLGVAAAAIVYYRMPAAPAEEAMAEAQPPGAPTSRPAMTLAPGDQHKTPSGLIIIETKEGTGRAAKAGDNVEVNYTGRLYLGGDKFDSSYDRGETLPFKVGAGQLIKGFDEGTVGLKVGGKRELVIPPDLGYGDAPAGGGVIPPSSTLVFDIELMKID